MRLRAMNLRDDEGQAIVLVCLAMGIFLLGAVGLGFDGSHLYSERQRAQLAADAAAQAAMMSIFNGTTGASGTGFPTTSTFTCTTTDTRTPCVYASKNGFGSTSADTVTIDYPGAAPGVSLSAAFTTNLVRATVSRNVNTTLMRLLGPTVTLVKASAEAAIVDVNAPVPILILHPTSTKKMPSPLSLQGTPTVQICGGPGRSIQVNSISTTAINIGGTAHIDLTKAGPKDTNGTCTTGTGADIGNHGGPGTSPQALTWYGTGKYVDPASIMLDPLRNVSPPSVPAVNGTKTTLAANATSGGVTCPSFTSPQGCTILTPGLYPTGIKLTGTYAMFRPGIYYLQGSNGFQCNSNCDAVMISGTPDGSTGTNTGWDGTAAGGGMLVYNTGTGQFQVGSNGNTYLIGSPSSSSYMGILFFQDRTSQANNVESSPPSGHSLGGGGAMTLVGTIYLTNTVATMSVSPYKHYQELDLQGSSGSGTKIKGEIIVDSLQMGGTGGIVMNLNSLADYIVSEVALVQ